MQAGELTGELRSTRGYIHLNTLKSVLSESSVANVKTPQKSEIESPKSAENVSSDPNPKKLEAKKIVNTEEDLETEMLGKLAEIDNWLGQPDDNSDSTNSKRSISPNYRNSYSHNHLGKGAKNNHFLE